MNRKQSRSKLKKRRQLTYLVNQYNMETQKESKKMKKQLKKLSAEKIEVIEKWALEKRSQKADLTKEEKLMLSEIDKHKINGWKGVLLTGEEQKQAEELQQKLDDLKLKGVQL